MKKTIKISLLTIMTLSIVCILMFLVQNYFIQKSFEKHIDGKIGDYGDDFIRCNWNILDVDIAYPFQDGENVHISFYKPGKIFWATSDDWNSARTGGTIVTNTTFSELVAMVKEDCSQFQESYIDLTGYEGYNELPYEEQLELWPEIDAKNLGWTYMPYTPDSPKQPEPELTEEEKAELEALKERARQETIERRANAVPIEDYYK